MSKKSIATKQAKEVDELCEDMIVVGPGQMLADARKNRSLSVEDVADKLNFTQRLVQNIEQDVFDQKLPATYNRGYLRCYAKLINIDINEVLSAYDMLGIAEVQRSEMQSFSNLTEKQAEHSRIMWLSYLIVAILIGLMVLWWLQESKQELDGNVVSDSAAIINQDAGEGKDNTAQLAALENEIANEQPEQAPVTLLSDTESTAQEIVAVPETINTQNIESNEKIATLVPEAEPALEQIADTEISTVIFTFSGDCWVNIYDNTGERIAWGVKKSGYEMTISGQAPFKVTLGRPELAAIVFNNQTIDMSSFSAGNIAKFTLPLTL